MKYYLAYGSNLSVEQMRARCPGAIPVGNGVIRDYRLEFKFNADIVPYKGCEVPVGCWAITDKDEERLDLYEGFPEYYVKRNMTITVKTFKRKRLIRVNAMFYVMREEHDLYPPMPRYYEGIVEGYANFKLNDIPLKAAYDRALVYYNDKYGKDEQV